MKQIYIDTYKGTFHPCDVDCVKYNVLTDKYTIYFYDRASGINYYANLIRDNTDFFIDDICSIDEKSKLARIVSKMQMNADLSILPSFLRSVNHKTITDDDVYIETNAMHAFKLIRKVEFLELKSYADAVNAPKYYYFIIEDMDPNIDGFDYKLKLSQVSNKPLKKNIIARHITDKSLSDLPFYGQLYHYTYDKNELLNINLDAEIILVNKIIELNKGRREIDTELLTKIVRMILKEDDRLKAAREYQLYLEKYYDKWIEEKKYTK